MPADEITDRARLAALTAFAFIRHAWFSWMEHPGTAPTLPELVEHSFAVGSELVASPQSASVG
jgi:hypothetical protein